LPQSASQTRTDEILIEAAVAVSSATVLAHLYPHEVPRISGHFDLHLQELRKQTSSNVALDAALAAGRAATIALLKLRDSDGATRLEIVTPPAAGPVWYSSEQWSPLRPYWGEVQPFLISQLNDYDPPPPPAPESAESSRALAAVREARRVGSSYNETIAKKWADGPGTSTPVGHWNEIAVTLIVRYRLNDVESARVLAFMNMALMDVSILCWRTKFKYWQMRPSQVDKTIVPSFPIPNFPSYPSGHAAFSGAAATFLGHRFPDEKQELNRLAEEAAESRVVSGLHYPFDSDAGLWQGRRVAAAAIAAYEKTSPNK
jgi:membrane-associated phospholipid phosphatase